MYKENLALNNLQWLVCHKTKPKPNVSSHQHHIKHKLNFS